MCGALMLDEKVPRWGKGRVRKFLPTSSVRSTMSWTPEWPTTVPRMPTRRPVVATLALTLALGVAGCSSEEDPQPVPATPGVTSSDPVIQPGLPGEPNATLSGSTAATAQPRATVAAGDVT